MLTLYDDIILKINEFLLDREKIKFATSSKLTDHLKYKYTYYEKINIFKVATLPYFNNFENIETPFKISKQAKCIYLKSQSTNIPHRITHLTLDNDNPTNTIPALVTHLMFGNCFNQPIHDMIPPFVTYLAFGARFNKPIKEYDIPTSVTHLIFGDDFNQPIYNCIPASVMYLSFGHSFNQPIDYCIPSSVIYLEFG